MKKVDGTLGPVVVSCCWILSLCQPYSLWALLQPVPAPAAPPDTTVIPLRYTEASSSGKGACLTSRFFLFRCGGKAVLARPRSKINTRLTAIWSTALNILRWQMPPTAWPRSPNKHSSSSRLQQSVRPTADQRPQTKLQIRSNKRSRVWEGGTSL